MTSETRLMPQVVEQLERYQRITANIWEFLPYVKILDATTNQIIQYEIWPHLVEFIRAIYKEKQVVVLKPKQVGISWTLAVIVLHHCYRMGALALELSRGQDEAADLLGKTRFIRSQLPLWLQLELEHDGLTHMTFKGTRARILALPSTEDAGVGYTASLVVRDELEYHEYAERNFAAIKPTIDAGGKIIDVSTSEKLKPESHFKQIYRRAKAGENNYYPIFIPWDARPGRDEEWYERVSRDYPEYQMQANYPRSEQDALSPVSGRSLFDAKTLQALLDKCATPIETRMGCVHIIARRKTGVRYYSGADIAEGRGGDASVLWIEGQEGLQREVCAIIDTNQMTIDNFAYQAFLLLNEYTQPYLVCGADAYGTNFLTELLNLGYPRARIYFQDKKRAKPGYVETEFKRQMDLTELEKALRTGLIVRYRPAVMQLFNFMAMPSGRFEAAKGTHDDIVLAAAKANVAFKQAVTEKPTIRVRYY